MVNEKKQKEKYQRIIAVLIGVALVYAGFVTEQYAIGFGGLLLAGWSAIKLNNLYNPE